MNLRFEIQSLKLFCLLIFSFCAASCGSVPNLEKPECTQARTLVREFYSYHFGNDLKPSKDSLQKREKFLSDELKQTLTAQPLTARDYFTQTEDFPKAFRVGGCEVVSSEKTDFSIVLFWKDDTRSEQREIKVEAVRQNDKWLIDKVSN